MTNRHIYPLLWSLGLVLWILLSSCSSPNIYLIEEEQRLREIVRIDPLSYEARFNLAMFLMRQQQNQQKDRNVIRESRQLFEQLLQEFPDDATADAARAATIYLEAELVEAVGQAGRLTAVAIQELDAIIAAHPYNAIVRSIRAEVYGELDPKLGKQETAYEDFRYAIAQFERFLGEDPHTLSTLLLYYRKKIQLGKKLGKSIDADEDRLRELRRQFSLGG